jgi:outer membrane protein
VKRSVKWVVAGAAMVLAGMASAAELKIGVVSLQRLMSESPQAKAALAALQTEFSTKQRELTALQASLKAKEEKLAKDGPTMTADQRAKAEKELRDGSRDYQAKATEYQDDVTARQNEETSRLQGEIATFINNYASLQKFDLVLYDGVIYANPALDITSAVLASIPNIPAAPARAPTPAAPKPAPAPAAGK